MAFIRAQAPTEEIDYNFLMGCLADYQRPREKITQLLKNKVLIRVKKGLYVFGEAYKKGPYSLEILSNLIYGPSYISKEYALAFYGMIPERVHVVTSMTSKRNKIFSTDLGRFSYRHLALHKYSEGVAWVLIGSNQHILIATKEKALADLIADVKEIKTVEDLEEYLTVSLRIDETQLRRLGKKKLQAIAKVYQHPIVSLLPQLIAKLAS